MAFNAELARKIGLTPEETSVYRRLNTPERIQDFLTDMPSNPELGGDTCYSARLALRHNCCHCIEAGFIAAGAMLLHGKRALFMHFSASRDANHIVTLFRRGRYWGAISKSNSIWLRWRDPIYASTRELAMSYFHEYVNAERKSLRGVTKPFNIGSYDPDYWLTSEVNCWAMAAELYNALHVPLVTPAQARRLRKREHFEVLTDKIKEFGPDLKRQRLITVTA